MNSKDKGESDSQGGGCPFEARQEPGETPSSGTRTDASFPEAATAFGALAEAAPDAIVTADAADIILYANPAAGRIFGYQVPELLGQHLTLLMPERFHASHSAGMLRYLETKVPHVIGKTVELAGVRKDGTEFPLELSLAGWRGQDGRQLFTGIMRDVTERHQVQEALHREIEYVQLLEAVAAKANEAASLRTALQYCIDRICAQMGWPVGHAYAVTESPERGVLVVPTNVWNQNAPECCKEFVETTRSLSFASGIGLPGRVHAAMAPSWIRDVTVDPNFPRAEVAKKAGLNAGFAFPVLSRTQVVAVLEFFSYEALEPDARTLEVMSYVGTQLGRVEERERAARELSEANASLERRVEERMGELQRINRELQIARDIALEASRAKSVFLANMSHELRTPLNAVIGYADLIREEIAESDCHHLVQDLERIRSAGTHLLGLVSDILDLSRIEAGRMELTIEPVSIAEVVSEAAQIVAPLIHAQGNQLNNDCVKDAGTIAADRMRLRQVVVNLLSNAAKFTEKGQITVRCWRAPGAGTPGEAEMLYISVADTGIGIAAQQLPRLFRKFEQLDASSTRRHGGSGLGLVISRSLCRLMGGDITAESRLGEGSTFTASISPDAPPGEAGPIDE